MHRNTYLLVSFLAVIAALIVGVNIGRMTIPSLTPQAPPQATVTSTPTPSRPQVKTYNNPYCRVRFEYPVTFTQLESASQAAAFRGPEDGDGILFTCQKDIPRPSVTEENMEDVRISSVSGKIYHTKSTKDETVVDSLIIRHPTTKLDIFLAGRGKIFKDIVSTLTFTP